MTWLERWRGKRNPNGSGIASCTCCGCPDGCDGYCGERRIHCKVHGAVEVLLPKATAIKYVLPSRYRLIVGLTEREKQWLVAAACVVSLVDTYFRMTGR